MSYLDDPRVFFAAERTLLAWVRTGLSVMGLGFVVAKFGIFLRYMAHEAAAPMPAVGLSLVLGTAMVVVGAAACALAALQFHRFVRRLSPQELPPGWSAALPSLFSWTLAAAGLVLACYLVL